MLTHTETIRVRYGETDQMGYVYYGNYALYYEVARVELLRKYGINYAELEKSGVGLPVADFHIRYLKPAKYDDLIEVKVTITKMPTGKITFHYETFNDQAAIINTGTVTLVFVSLKTGKPVRCPQALESFFLQNFGK